MSILTLNECALGGDVLRTAEVVADIQHSGSLRKSCETKALGENVHHGVHVGLQVQKECEWRRMKEVTQKQSSGAAERVNDMREPEYNWKSVVAKCPRIQSVQCGEG